MAAPVRLSRSSGAQHGECDVVGVALRSAHAVLQCIKNGKYMAIKCMKTTFPSVDQVNNLREIQALRRLLPHPNIVKLEEVL